MCNTQFYVPPTRTIPAFTPQLRGCTVFIKEVKLTSLNVFRPAAVKTVQLTVFYSLSCSFTILLCVTEAVGRLEEHPPCQKCALKQLLPCPSVPGKLPLNWLCVYVVNLATR